MKYLVRTSGPHFGDAKIYHRKEVLKHQEQLHQRYENYMKNEKISLNRWELNIYTSDSIAPAWQTSYLHGFDDIYDAKMYILEQKIEWLKICENKLKEVTKEPQILQIYNKIQGRKKLENTIRNLKFKHPEKQL